MSFLRLRWLVCAAAFAPAVGCTWAKSNLGITPNSGGKHTPLASVQPEQLVGYLNDRATRTSSIIYKDVRLRAYENRVPMPALDGTLACAQPRNLRLKCSRAIAGDLDLGSNNEQFWAYVKATGNPMFIYCSYSDFESGRARLPGSMPFEPDWIMQVLGMTRMPLDATYTSSINDKERTYTLSWPARTPQGLAVRKEIVFEGDAATANRPQVKKHLVKDAKTGNVICYADVKRAETVQTAAGVVQYPTEVSLRWEEQKFTMDLSLGEARVNEPPSPDQAAKIYSMPRNLGANPINLAEYRVGAR